MTSEQPQPPTAFHDLDHYIALPRLSGLAVSADGTRLVTAVATLDPKKTRYVSALWEVDPTGERPARRLTRSRKGEAAAVFTDAGDVLFTSARPDPDSEEDDGPAALWLLPADGTEARVICARPGGVGAVRTAGDAVVLSADVLPSASDEADEARLRKERKEGKVSAILHDTYPIRSWDTDLGPGVDHLLTGTIPALPADAAAATARLELRDLTPDARRGEVADFDLARDGSVGVIVWSAPEAGGVRRARLEVVEVASGERRTLLDVAGADLEEPRLSPDARFVACSRWAIHGPEKAIEPTWILVDVATGEHRELAPGWDRWPHSYRWSGDGAYLFVVADEDGRAPVFALEVSSGKVTRLTDDDAAFSDVEVSPDGAWLYALRSSYMAPPEVVRIDVKAALADGPVVAETLRGPVSAPELPGRLTEVETTADDGVRVRAWLALPKDADADHPAPMLLWIHGGPLSSWNSWSWRWNPWLLVAQGYAVLLPDPALSTGYGQDFIERGWNAWGDAPFTDLMAITDAAVARPDIDGERTAAMGGSFGGYMANWVAGHTDRFRAIVTHASLWALDQFGPTTDHAYFWEREFSPEGQEASNPRLHVDKIVTPMLVIHGDKDYRVPIGEGLRLWYELLRSSQLAADDQGRTPHRFLYFPDENHWILTPQHAKVWYQVVSAFLAEHVLGEAAGYPEILG